ncbi:MAG: hypothetical protein R2838_24115 [Caldilineaceae bacterium]
MPATGLCTRQASGRLLSQRAALFAAARKLVEQVEAQDPGATLILSLARCAAGGCHGHRGAARVVAAPASGRR